MTLNELFKNTTYDDTLFSVEDKSTIESRIFMKSVRGSEVPYITCAIRDKEIKLTPEEAVRQLYIYKLMNDYGYAASRIQLETPIHFGREVKRADIAIMDKDRPMVPYIIVEKLNHQAQILYSEAKQILIKELKVCTEGITSDSYTTKYLSTSFKVSGRLDAEYYQPKYDGYLSALEQFETTKIPNEFDVLKNSGTNYAEGVSDVGVIKTKQLTNSGVNTDGIESYFTHETCIENKSTLVVNNDVVFASMGVGSLGKVSLFSYDGDKPFVTDSTLRIYRAKKHTHVLPEVLCIFLQSAIGQELIYRYVVGSTGIINIYDDDIAKIPIPILDGEIQKDIAEKVQNSFALRRQSKQLLEYAKQAVEMAIEQGEDAALVWLKERSGE